jgi:two-component system, LytTR family, sensor histidine kinase LytS
MKRFDWTRLFLKPYKWYTQLVFWIVVFFLYILLKEYPQRMTGATLICLVLQETLELMIPSYTQNLGVLPLFQRRKWGWAIPLYLVQLCLLVIVLPYILNAVGAIFGALFHVTDLVDWRQEHITFSMVAFTIIASCVRIALDRLIREKEQKENELRHLKAQLNPHFLFNTLNNLYGLSVAESRRLPGLMLQLSDLLRYSLYDTNQPYVALQKEADYIANYVDLEKIRLNDNTDIRLDIQGDLTEQYIAPLLLIVLIENSFKHLSAARGQRAFVHILLAIKDKRLQLNVKNSVDPSFERPRTSQRAGGLGLDNVRQRLDLIYRHQYTLTTHKGPEDFEANLQIELS